MRTQVVDHPLVTHKLTTLRDESTDSPTFRALTEELVALLAYEATRDVRVAPVQVQTPVAVADGVRLAAPKPLVVPILRAGLGMLDGFMRLLPTAEVGFLGMVKLIENMARDGAEVAAELGRLGRRQILSGKDQKNMLQQCLAQRRAVILAKRRGQIKVEDFRP